MVLIEQGKVKLEDPVEKYLPEFEGKRVEGSQGPVRPMTIRHLLSHTAGFWGNKEITPEKLDLIRNFERPLDEAVKLIVEYDLVYEPGTNWIYSGSGYCVAGRIAEVARDDCPGRLVPPSGSESYDLSAIQRNTRDVADEVSERKREAGETTFHGRGRTAFHPAGRIVVHNARRTGCVRSDESDRRCIQRKANSFRGVSR